MIEVNKIYNEPCQETISRMPDKFLDLSVTSPPYWGLRDYGHDDQLGLETTFQQYLENIFNVFQLLRPKLKDTGAVWVNLGDTYSTPPGKKRSGFTYKNKGWTAAAKKAFSVKRSKSKLPIKTLVGIPDRFKIMMIDAGWICRNDIIWHKPNAMPSSVKDNFTVDYERFFFFVKKPIGYYFEQQFNPIKQSTIERMKRACSGEDKYSHKNNTMCGKPSRKRDKDKNRETPDKVNMRTLWSISTKSFNEAHFATFPNELITIPIKACSPQGGVVYDPFGGAGTTFDESIDLDRNCIISEISRPFCDIALKRLTAKLSQGNLYRKTKYENVGII